MFWYHKSESCEPYVAVYTELSYMPFYESGPQDDTEILFLNEHVVTPKITGYEGYNQIVGQRSL